jgi:hypothetical protein
VLPSTAAVTTWAAPAQMTDLSAFNISAFAGGQQNLEIVNGIPADASATVVAATAESTGSDVLGSSPPWDNSTSVLRLLYPANSINPGNNPQGGAQFYATPLQINDAQNISLEYSVFFPVNFDWVLAGKLPGMYGGHRGCSGGDDALTCFSTRLMWRRSGAGELYLVGYHMFHMILSLSFPFSMHPRTNKRPPCAPILSPSVTLRTGSPSDGDLSTLRPGRGRTFDKR